MTDRYTHTIRPLYDDYEGVYDGELCVLKVNGKAAQWVPVSTNSLQLRTDVATQTVGLFYPSQRQMNQKNDEMEQKLNAVKEMYERRPVVLTAVSPGKGQLVYVSFCLVCLLRRTGTSEMLNRHLCTLT